MIDYSQAWNSLAPASGLMSWATPQWGWGAAGQTASTPIPQTGLAALQGRTAGEGTGAGYSTPTNQNTGPQTPGDMQRSREVMGQLGGYATGRLGNTAIGALGATAMGMAPSISDVVGAGVQSLASPHGLAGLTGKVAAQQMGFAGPTGWTKTAMNTVNPVIGGILGMVNPALGLAYGLMSPFGMDIAADGLNARKDENYKDAMEDAHGTFGGRSVSKDMTGLADRHGFGSMTNAYGAQGYSALDAAMGMTNKDASSMARGQSPMGYGGTYGGWGSIGGPLGGVKSTEAGFGGNYGTGYGPSMGGFAGLGIGNPSSYGGRNSASGDSDRGGFGANDGDSDTAGNGGYGR